MSIVYMIAGESCVQSAMDPLLATQSDIEVTTDEERLSPV